MRDPAEHLNVHTPVVPVEAPRNVRASIDEILEGPIAPNETGRFKRTDALGRIPAPPPPLRSSATPPIDLPIQDFPKATKSFDSSASPDFGGTGRQSQPDVGGVSPSSPRQGTFDRTVAMEGRPAEPTHPSAKFEEETKRSVEVGATGPMPRYVPPASGASQPQAPTAPSRPQMPTVSLHPPTAPMPAVVAPAALPSAPPRPLASRPAPAPVASVARRSHAPLAVGACLAIVIGAIVAGSVTYARGQARERLRAAQAATTVTAPAAPSTAPTPTPAPTPLTPEPSPSPTPAAPEAAPAAAVVTTATEGLLKTTGALPGRRIFVDAAVVGQTPESITVKCGSHVVHLGSSGKNQTIDIPCGGELVVSDKY